MECGICETAMGRKKHGQTCLLPWKSDSSGKGETAIRYGLGKKKSRARAEGGSVNEHSSNCKSLRYFDGNWNYDRYLRASCEKKLTVNLAVTWELLGIAAILSGAVSEIFGWSSRIGLGSLVVLLITALLVLWGVYQMTIQISSLLMKNQELAILVSLLNQENERILRELEN